MKTYILLTLVIINVSCQHPQPSGPNKFADTLLVKISDLQDKRDVTALVPLFKHTSSVYRAAAVLAFASIQDSSLVTEIGDVLQRDADTSVRTAAAFALGQTYCRDSERILSSAYDKETNQVVAAEMLNAYGRVTKKWVLKLPADSTLRRAFAWGLYRAGMAGAGDSVINSLAASLLKSVDDQTRLGAAHYFARSATKIESFQTEIIRTAGEDPSDLVRMAAVIALRKIKSLPAQRACEKIALSDSSYRVRVNAVRALQSFDAAKTKDVLIRSLSDKNINVGIAASEVIRDYPPTAGWSTLVPIARTEKNWRIQANLYDAALAGSGDAALASEIQSLYLKSQNPYQKAALLSTLKHVIKSYVFVNEQFKTTTVPVILSAAAAALVGMNHNKDFDIHLRSTFVELYRSAMATGDAAVIAIIASALAEPELDYKREIKDFAFLYEAKKKLSLPKDNETIQSLDAAIYYFEEKEIVPVRNEYNHPVDWELVKTISRDQQATLYTSKGNIIMRLFVEEAPGSVANFVALVNQNYFNDKFFHRVVPNFVVQGGCNRGDGYGSEDYSIRSEFSGRRYKTGSIGMASAGKDTEGTQWFITHSPTPHLDGRYTIFAEVESGMEIVHQLEVGDKILKIELK